VYATPSPVAHAAEMVNSFKFIPRDLQNTPDGIILDVSYAGTRCGAFRFTGNQLARADTLSGLPDVTPVDFHYQSAQLHSLQPTSSPLGLFKSRPYFEDKVTNTTA